MLVKLKPCSSTHTLGVWLRGPRKTKRVSHFNKKRQLLQKKTTTTTERQLWPEISLLGVSGLFFCYLRIPPATVQLCRAAQGTTICVWRRRRRRVLFSSPHYKLPLWAESQTDPGKTRANMLTDQWRQRLARHPLQPSDVQQPQTHGLHLRAD